MAACSLWGSNQSYNNSYMCHGVLDHGLNLHRNISLRNGNFLWLLCLGSMEKKDSGMFIPNGQHCRDSKVINFQDKGH